MKKISKKWLVIGGIIVLLLLLRNGGNATMALHQILYRAIVLVPRKKPRPKPGPPLPPPNRNPKPLPNRTGPLPRRLCRILPCLLVV